MEIKKLNEKEAVGLTNRSSFKAMLPRDVPMWKFVKLFGPPTADTTDWDDKVTQEWVFLFEGHVITVYDYRGGLVLHVGGFDQKVADRFVEYVEQLKKEFWG